MWFVDDKKSILNIGLSSFADAINQTGATATQVEWQPPAEGNREDGLALARIVGHPLVEAANKTAFDAYLMASPVIKGVDSARNVIPGFDQKIITHAGPPIEWDDMCGPMQGAMIGACLFEGWAKTDDEARNLLAGGAIKLGPCHHHQAVGPMAGIISPSMPVWIVENTQNGARTFSNMNEGLGKVLRFGAYSEDVQTRLHWMSKVLGPTLKAALEKIPAVELKPIMAQALHMGDEVHNRNAAATGLLLKKLTPALLDSGVEITQVSEVIKFLSANDHTFLNLSMAACKAMLDAARDVPNSTMVTAMARNGVKFGIQVSGLGNRWFIADALSVDGLYFSGYSEADAAKDLGDSAITETAGVGGFAMASAPAIVQFVGGTPRDALARTQEMSLITLGDNPAFTLPALNFNGTPAGIDCREVVDSGVLPVINTGIAHKEAGVGQIGAGITRAPLGCFVQAIRALDQLMHT